VVAKRRWRRITPEVRRAVIGLARRGATYEDIKGTLDLPIGSISLVLRRFGGVVRVEQCTPPAGARLSLDDRIEVQLGIGQGKSVRAIAVGLGRSPSTISREIVRHGGRRDYKAVVAHRRADGNARRPKTAKLACRELAARVEALLLLLWSPQEIAAMLRLEFADRPEMWVSHETIYKSLFVQGRGELRRELHRCLRTGRAQRRHQGRVERRGHIPNMVMIAERPAEADDRAVPGHWEGDLIMGANNHSAIGTLVERSTRFVMLLHLPGDHGAEAVRDAMTAKIATLPEALRRSITWDQGVEMAQHAQFSIDTGVPV
jgi:transposase, IS30 family